MSIKITIDNNFFDELFKLKDKNLREEIIGRFQKKHFSLYVNIELVSELLGLKETSRSALLQIFAKALLDMNPTKFFNPWNWIILSELGIKDETIFADAEVVKGFYNIFRELASGKIPQNIDQMIAEIEKDKNKRFESLDKLRQVHLCDERAFLTELKKKDQRLEKPKDFEEFYNLEATKSFIRNLTKDFLSHNNNRLIAECEIEEILNNHNKFCYYHTMFRSNAALIYRHIVLGERVDHGDDYDFKQMVYVTNLDYLISNDVRICKIGQDVFSGREKVLNFQDFIKNLVI